jgi:hypothetical protein
MRRCRSLSSSSEKRPPRSGEPRCWRCLLQLQCRTSASPSGLVMRYPLTIVGVGAHRARGLPGPHPGWKIPQWLRGGWRIYHSTSFLRLPLRTNLSSGPLATRAEAPLHLSDSGVFAPAPNSHRISMKGAARPSRGSECRNSSMAEAPPGSSGAAALPRAKRGRPAVVCPWRCC